MGKCLRRQDGGGAWRFTRLPGAIPPGVSGSYSRGPSSQRIRRLADLGHLRPKTAMIALLRPPASEARVAAAPSRRPRWFAPRSFRTKFILVVGAALLFDLLLSGGIALWNVMRLGRD